MALVCLGKPLDVLGVSGMVELLVCPCAFGPCEGVSKGFGGHSLCGTCGSSVCHHVGSGALVIPPSDPPGVEGSSGLECKLVSVFNCVVKVSEGIVEVQCGCGQLAWGVMI